ncbi:MAG: hypothetical protein IID44_03295 [Planctomycetes bacterium]|nr:hypothetical protein [Planctomycetota bacterium]
MKSFAYLAVAVAVFGILNDTLADEPFPVIGKEARPLRGPREPGGILNDRLGTYLTIEGVRADVFGKGGERILLVDTVNGKMLAKPVGIVVQNLELPSKKRCILKGYETGEMGGEPPAVFAAAKEQGKKFFPAQAAWAWHTYVVVLIVKAPEDLPIKRAFETRTFSPRE